MANVPFETHKVSGFTARLVNGVQTLKDRYARYRVYRDTLSELQQLSHRELADLGLSRSMLRRVAYHAAYE